MPPRGVGFGERVRTEASCYVGIDAAGAERVGSNWLRNDKKEVVPVRVGLLGKGLPHGDLLLV